MGIVRYQAVTDILPVPVEVFGSGFLDPAHYLHEAAMVGFSCTLCHQIQLNKLGNIITLAETVSWLICSRQTLMFRV
jgi:hypothetical protein